MRSNGRALLVGEHVEHALGVVGRARPRTRSGGCVGSESTSNAAVRDRPNVAQRSHSGRKASHATISMNVANASLSQMPFHHFIVTRSPNHMWASSWAMTSATRCSSGWVAGRRVDEQQRLAEGDAAEVLHRAEGEVGHGDQVDLVARVGDAVVVAGSSAAQNAPTSSAKPVRWPLPGTCTTRSGVPSTSTGSVASSGPTMNATR